MENPAPAEVLPGKSPPRPPDSIGVIDQFFILLTT